MPDSPKRSAKASRPSFRSSPSVRTPRRPSGSTSSRVLAKAEQLNRSGGEIARRRLRLRRPWRGARWSPSAAASAQKRVGPAPILTGLAERTARGRDRVRIRAVHPPQPVRLEISEPLTGRLDRRADALQSAHNPLPRLSHGQRIGRHELELRATRKRLAQGHARRSPHMPQQRPTPPPRVAPPQPSGRARAPCPPVPVPRRRRPSARSEGCGRIRPYTNICSHMVRPSATDSWLSQSMPSGPLADPLRNWRTNGFSEENIRSASPASTIRPRHSSAMYSPIWRAEAMLWVTTM